MTSLQPGPSEPEPKLGKYLQEAFEQGILSLGHRSARFSEIYNGVLRQFREKLYLPEDYAVFFVSSATECWEIIAEHFADRDFYHVWNGSFGERWFQRTEALGRQTCSLPFDVQDAPPELSGKNGVLCLTYNETSNGSRLPAGYISKTRRQNPGGLLAIDATSAMAGIEYNWEIADIWFASAQKCFGLPAGLAVLICGPRVLEALDPAAPVRHYNSLNNLYRHYLNRQTTHTPNVLNIYLLERVLRGREWEIEYTHGALARRAERVYRFLESSSLFAPLVEPKSLRSETVIAVRTPEDRLDELNAYARQNFMTLGRGYGPWKRDTFRIANFPAIKDGNYTLLADMLTRFEAGK